MKAALIHQYGPASELQVEEVDRPQPSEGQVLVRVIAAAINPIEWKIRNGEMAFRYGQEFPKILGFDLSGIVEEVGEGVTSVKPGDEIMSRADVGNGGSYAEYNVVRQETLALKPSNVSFEDAAALPLAGITALQGLRDCGNLKKGQRILIVGASGGVGTFAVQIANNMGAYVVGVCSAGNADLVRDLGADEVIDYATQDVLGASEPYDVVYDTVGTQLVGEVLKVLSPDGVYMTLVPNQEDIDFFVPGNSERAGQKGYFVMCEANNADLAALADMMAQGTLRSIIDSTYSLDDIRLAHERSESLRARGKIIVQIQTP